MGTPSARRPRQISSALPKGRRTRIARETTRPQCAARRASRARRWPYVGKNYEAVGVLPATSTRASPPSPGGVRAPEKCRPGRARRSRRRRTGGRRRPAAAPTLGVQADAPVRYVQNRVSSAVHCSAFCGTTSSRRSESSRHQSQACGGTISRKPCKRRARTVSRAHARGYGCVQR